MMDKLPILFAALVVMVSPATNAQEVYESVDKEGVIEFSDTPSAGAEAVDVEPNVLDIDPATPVEGAGAGGGASASGGSEVVEGEQRTEVVEGDAGYGYLDDDVPVDKREQREMRRDDVKTVVEPEGDAMTPGAMKDGEEVNRELRREVR